MEEHPAGDHPHPSDVLVFCKRHMADPEPFRVLSLVPARVAVQLRANFQQPSGNISRRTIGESVRKNIRSHAPRCHAQGSISADALAYLLSWVEGSLPRLRRPSSYSILELRRHPILHVPQPAVGAWIAPRRHRVITVLRSDDDADSDDDVADNAPIEWDDGQ